MNATKKLLLLAALLAPSAAAFANEGAHIDAYYIPSSKLELDVPGFPKADDTGDGFGGKAMIPLGRTQSFFLSGEYQTSTFDDFNIDVDQVRVGGGWQTPLATGTLGLYGEYTSIDFDGSKADGIGVHARLSFPIAPAVRLYGQIGYLALEDDSNADVDGLEFLIGGSVDFTRNIGAFIDFRQSNLSADDSGGDIDYTLQDLRIGVRFLFRS